MTVVGEGGSVVRILSGKGNLSETEPWDPVVRSVMGEVKGAIVDFGKIFWVRRRRLRDFHFPGGLRDLLYGPGVVEV